MAEECIPDFSSIDKMVQEYTNFRQSEQMAGDKLSPDDIVEKIMKCFDTGMYTCFDVLLIYNTAK
jgi:hypothetical protein